MGIPDIFKKTPIGFGGASISGEGGGYGFGHINRQDACSLLEYAFDRGIRIFDTAPIYGFGLSEERMGEALRKVRDHVYIVSKSGIFWDENKRVKLDNNPSIAEKMLQDSLTRLKTDYIDLYMVHWPDPDVDIRKTLEVYQDALEKRIIRAVGLCNTNKKDFLKAREIVDIQVLQSEYHLFCRETLHKLKDCLTGRDFMAWGTLDKGIITGRVDENRSFDPVDCRGHAPWWNKKDVLSKVEKMKKVHALLKENGHNSLELALAFNLQKKNHVSLCGMRTKEQLDGIINAFVHPPEKDLIEKAVNLLST